MGSSSAFRFGVLSESVRTRGDLVEIAGRAEATGFSTFLIRDHFVAEPFGPQLGPIATLATVAAITTTLRVGSLVFSNDYRHPLELAKEVATIDPLSGGRFELGLGAGFTQREYKQLGRTLDTGAARVRRLEEAVDLITGLMNTSVGDFAGADYSLRDAELFPAPVQRPRPPILIGGAGHQILSLAARKADIVGLQTVSTTGGVVRDGPRRRAPAEVAREIRWTLDQAGARAGTIELSSTIVLMVADDRLSAAQRVARARRWAGVSAEDVRAMPSVFIGDVARIADEMFERRARFGLSYFIVSDTVLEAVAPVIARLRGA